MGIYIEGMNMSNDKNGFINLIIFNDGRCFVVIGENEITSKTGMVTARELSPHGRLIDADALERNLREMADYQHGDRQQGILGCCSTICSADTIIPADGGADG